MIWILFLTLILQMRRLRQTEVSYQSNKLIRDKGGILIWQTSTRTTLLSHHFRQPF